MRKLVYILSGAFLLTLIVILGQAALAQVGWQPGDPAPSTMDWMSYISNFKNVILDHIKDGTVSKPLIMFTIVQGAFMLLRTKVGDLLGVHKLAIVAGLSVIVTVLQKFAVGAAFSWASLLTILTDSSTLWSIQVALNQIKKQWDKVDADVQDNALASAAAVDKRDIVADPKNH